MNYICSIIKQNMPDRETLTLCTVGACLTAVFFLIIAVPLYTAGYQKRVKWNDDLVTTTCTWTSHQIRQSRCSYQCNCYETCTTVVRRREDGTTYTTQDCDTHCQTCYRDCWHTSCSFKYSVKNTEEYRYKTKSQGTSYSASGANSLVNSRCPINGTWTCFYHGSDPSKVVNGPYDAKGFYIAAMVFFAFLAAAGAWCLTSGGIWGCTVLNDEGSDFCNSSSHSNNSNDCCSQLFEGCCCGKSKSTSNSSTDYQGPSSNSAPKSLSMVERREVDQNQTPYPPTYSPSKELEENQKSSRLPSYQSAVTLPRVRRNSRQTQTERTRKRSQQFEEASSSSSESDDKSSSSSTSSQSSDDRPYQNKPRSGGDSIISITQTTRPVGFGSRHYGPTFSSDSGYGGTRTNRYGMNRYSSSYSNHMPYSSRTITNTGGDEILSVTTTTRPVCGRVGSGFSTHEVREGSHPYGW